MSKNYEKVGSFVKGVDAGIDSEVNESVEKKVQRHV